MRLGCLGNLSTSHMAALPPSALGCPRKWLRRHGIIVPHAADPPALPASSQMMQMMLRMLAMRNKGLKIADNEGEMQGNRNCTKMKRALERNQNAGNCKGRTRREPEDGTERNCWKLWATKRN